MSSLLERQLEQAIAPVRAPEPLWHRVEAQCDAAFVPRERPAVAKWPILAAAALAACGLAAAVFAPSSSNYIVSAKTAARFSQPAAASESGYSCRLCHVD